MSSHQIRRDWNTRSEPCRKIPENRSIALPVWLARVVAAQNASVCSRNSAFVREETSPGPGCQRLRRSEIKAMQVLNHNPNCLQKVRDVSHEGRIPGAITYKGVG